MLKSFNPVAIASHNTSPAKSKAMRRQSSYYKVFQGISDRKEAHAMKMT